MEPNQQWHARRYIFDRAHKHQAHTTSSARMVVPMATYFYMNDANEFNHRKTDVPKPSHLALQLHGQQLSLATLQLLLLQQPVKLALDLVPRQVAAEQAHKDVRARRRAVAEQRRGESLHHEKVAPNLGAAQAHLSL